MEESIFTKIVKGEIPCQKIYEDELTLAFLNIHPINPGHTLVIPKKQIAFLWDLPDEDYQAVMSTVKKVGVRIREIINPVRVGVHVVGLDVPHAHVHVFPFNTIEEFTRIPDQKSEPDYAALAEMAQKLALQ